MQYPAELSIELTNVCNLNCMLCDNSQITRPRGFMSLENYKKLIDETAAHIKRVNFGVTAEPLLHTQVDAFIRYAKEKGIHTSLTTNATLLSRFTTRLLSTGLDNIVLSFDGMTRTSYEAYRRGAVEGVNNFQMAKTGIEQLCAERKQSNSQTPHITISFMVNRHNEHEIDTAKEWAKSIGADVLLLKSMHFNWAGQDKTIMQEWAPSNQEFVRHYDYRQLGICTWVRDNTVVYWNGEIASCCFDLVGNTTFGNAFDKGFKSVWESKVHLDAQSPMADRSLPQCIGCSAGVSIGTRVEFGKKSPLNWIMKKKELITHLR